MIDSIVAADLWFENLMLALRTPIMLDIMRTITFLGDAFPIVVITAIVSIYFAVSGKSHWPYLAGLGLTLSGAIVSSSLLKMLVVRARPDGLIPSIVETASSFPSRHAVAAVALYGFLAFSLSRIYPAHSKKLSAGATILIFSIGMSRLYLGVHFPTDVLAGFALGGTWLLLGIWAVRKLQLSRYFNL